MRLASLTRRVTFSSGHRYWNPTLSREENRAIFGEWASPYNHGHNYALEVTTEGSIDPVNGMVVNIKDIDDILQEHVVGKFDQRSINDEIPEFADVPPSTENLLLHFAKVLPSLLPPEAVLTRLKLEETPRLWGEWKAHPTMLTLTRTYEFAASHRLFVHALSQEENDELFGKCSRPNSHGHNYIVEVTVAGEPNPTTGMMCDIGQLDEIVNRLVVDRYDHYNLNLDIPEFAGINPTSEVVAQVIFDTLKNALPGRLQRIRLHETERNIFEVSE